MYFNPISKDNIDSLPPAAATEEKKDAYSHPSTGSGSSVDRVGEKILGKKRRHHDEVSKSRSADHSQSRELTDLREKRLRLSPSPEVDLRMGVRFELKQAIEKKEFLEVSKLLDSATSPDTEKLWMKELRLVSLSNTILFFICAAANKHACAIQVLFTVAKDKKIPIQKLLFASLQKGWTPMHLAVINSHEKVIKTLLAAAIDAHIPIRQLLLATDQDDCTPLHLAAALGHEKTIKILLTAAIDAHIPMQQLLLATDQDDFTPLHLAAMLGHEETIKTLLAAAINTHIPIRPLLLANSKGAMTPLMIAAQNNHTQVVAAIIQFVHDEEISTETLSLTKQLFNKNTLKLLIMNKEMISFFINYYNKQVELFLVIIRKNKIDTEQFFYISEFIHEHLNILGFSKITRNVRTKTKFREKLSYRVKKNEFRKKISRTIPPNIIIINSLKLISNFTKTQGLILTIQPHNNFILTLNNLFKNLTFLANRFFVNHPEEDQRIYEDVQRQLTELREFIEKMPRKRQNTKESDIFVLLAEFGTLGRDTDPVNYQTFFGVEPKDIYALGIVEGYDLEAIGAYNFLDDSERDQEKLSAWIEQLKTLTWYEDIKEDIERLNLHLDNKQDQATHRVFRNIRVKILRRYFKQNTIKIQNLLSQHKVSSLSEILSKIDIPFASRFDLVDALKSREGV